MADDHLGTPGYFLPIETLVKRTTNLLMRYIFVTRPSIMKQRPANTGDHPFLFVSSGRAAKTLGQEVGAPYTMTAFENAWEQAVRRVGRLHDDPTMAEMRKWRGTTPHGGRHFYGRFLFSIGLEPSVIQRCMHHKTLNAHSAYTRLTPSEVNEIVQEANHNLSGRESSELRKAKFASQFQNNITPDQ